MNQSRPGNIASLTGIALVTISFMFLLSTLTPSLSSARIAPPILAETDGGGDEWPNGVTLPDSPGIPTKCSCTSGPGLVAEYAIAESRTESMEDSDRFERIRSFMDFVNHRLHFIFGRP